MEAPLRPLLFRPVYKDYLWGGSRIAERFGRTGTPAPCAESWEVSAHPDGMSVVESGPFDGRTLADLFEAYGPALAGTYAEGPRFPLLVKLIDASKRLSVQVHPDDEGAARHGGEAKTEMWYFLDAEPGAQVCAGLKDGVGPRIFADAVRERQVSALLRAVDAEPGKALYIPGGLVHAICEGCLVLEVQQNSNTTYRVYDWDRVGPDGRPRELHVAKAMEAIGWKIGGVGLSTPFPMPSADPRNVRERVVRSDYFTMERLTLRAPEPGTLDGRTFRILFAADADLVVTDGGGETAVPRGRSCLLPASLGAYAVAPRGAEATVLTVEL